MPKKPSLCYDQDRIRRLGTWRSTSQHPVLSYVIEGSSRRCLWRTTFANVSVSSFPTGALIRSIRLDSPRFEIFRKSHERATRVSSLTAASTSSGSRCSKTSVLIMASKLEFANGSEMADAACQQVPMHLPGRSPCRLRASAIAVGDMSTPDAVMPRSHNAFTPPP